MDAWWYQPEPRAFRIGVSRAHSKEEVAWRWFNVGGCGRSAVTRPGYRYKMVKPQAAMRIRRTRMAAPSTVAIESVRGATAEEWDAYWMGCRAATYFHSREWVEAWRVYTSGRVEPSARHIAFSDGASAVLPIAMEQFRGGLSARAWMSLAGTYGGWLSADTLTPHHVGLIYDWVARSFRSAFWRLNPFDPSSTCLADRVVEPGETQAIWLADGIDAAFAKSREDHRWAVRKAVREGVTTRRAASLDDWRAYYAVYEDSLRRWGEAATSRYGWRLFEALYDLASPHISLWLAEKEGQIISGALCFYAARNAVEWHAASLEKSLPAKPADMLKHAAMEEGCSRSIDWYDLGPSGGHEGVRAFKAKLGPTVLQAPVVCRPSRRFTPTRRLAGNLKRRLHWPPASKS